MKNVLEEVVEKIKTRILCSITFFRRSCLLWGNVGKYGRAGISQMAAKYGIITLN